MIEKINLEKSFPNSQSVSQNNFECNRHCNYIEFRVTNFQESDFLSVIGKTKFYSSKESDLKKKYEKMNLYVGGFIFSPQLQVLQFENAIKWYNFFLNESLATFSIFKNKPTNGGHYLVHPISTKISTTKNYVTKNVFLKT